MDDLPTVLDILAYIIFAAPWPATIMLHLFHLTEDDIQTMLVPLTSVLTYDPHSNNIHFCHASLPDFLRDEKRSGQYCIRALPTRLSILLLGQMSSGKYRRVDSGMTSVNLQRG